MRAAIVHGLVLLSLAAAPAQPAMRESVQRYRQANEAGIVRELAGFVAIPNLASDTQNIRRNALQLVEMMSKRGIEARLLEDGDAPPVVYGELRSPGARRTLVFYAHYDGQPVDPAQWKSPPWTPVLRDRDGKDIAIPAARGAIDPEARLFGRSASDDKAPIVAMLAALDALRAAGVTPSVNLKFFFEGEEEAESKHLATFLERNRALLASDGWIFCDGPVHQSRRMQVVYGARGVVSLDLTVYGPTRALHDGHYGNWAPNPAARLASLLASMRDPEGKVLIAGFSDGVRPIGDAERAAIAKFPNVDGELRKSLGLARTEADDAPLPERILMPALNVRGLQAGHVGKEAANAIPTEAQASIDLRLVPDQKLDAVKQAVEKHIAGQGYFIVREDPDAATRLSHARLARVRWGGGYRGVRLPLDAPLSRAVAGVVDGAMDDAPVVQLPILGGSVPLATIQDALGAPIVIVPIVNHDNNQHAANENLRLQNLWDGIQVFAALFAELGNAWGQPGARPP
jgi:acetylornithine deacetylase/succinyl-diaminopimelate desuccinylase-like protein